MPHQTTRDKEIKRDTYRAGLVKRADARKKDKKK